MEGEIPPVNANFSYVCQNGETTNVTCATNCIGLDACAACQCDIIDVNGGPWGSAMDVILCLLPIVFLLVVTLKPRPMSTTLSLPLSALLLLIIRLMYLGSNPTLVFSSVILGLHEALTPLSIMFGAMLLFETMENTLCLPYMMREMKVLTNGHTVADLMIIFSFAYMVEGASGFGTPAALGAPMLASLGYPKFESVVTLLLMNTFATIWGAAGTPIWFGFGNLGLSETDFIQISFKGGTALVVAAYLLLPSLVLTKTCSLRVLRQNALFVFLSITAVMAPAFAISFVSFEFPALVGGMVGCGLNAVLIKFKVGMRAMSDEDVRESGRVGRMETGTSAEFSIVKEFHNSINSGELQMVIDSVKNSIKKDNVPEEEDTENGQEKNGQENGTGSSTKGNSVKLSFANSQVSKPANNIASSATTQTINPETIPMEEGTTERAMEHYLGPRKSYAEGYIRECVGRTFPLWGVVLLLVLTRIPQIGLKGILTAKNPAFEIHFGSYGEFRCSASLVLQLNNILTWPGMNWKYELLYIPFIMPFMIVSVVTMALYKNDLQNPPKIIFGSVAQRLINPAKALMGALVLVQLLIKDGPASPSSLIGNTLANAFKGGWIAIAAFIGALGSFFSGSTTISNLTFGEIQQIAAKNIGTSESAMLALQAAGASAGNGICLNNIIAACAVVGLQVGEGKVIAKTGLPVGCFCVLAMCVMLAFYFRF